MNRRRSVAVPEGDLRASVEEVVRGLRIRAIVLLILLVVALVASFALAAHFVALEYGQTFGAIARQHLPIFGSLATLFIVLGGATGWFILRPAIRRIRDDVGRKAEAAARDAEILFETSVDMVCIGDTQGRLNRVSPSSTRILGYTPEELEGAPWAEFVHPDDRQATLEAASRITEGEDIAHLDNRYITKSGDVRMLSWRIRADLERETIYASARDVTRQHQIADQLERHARELERSNQELDDFAYVASHDLRAPLRDIDNLASWLEDDVNDLLPELSRGHLEKIRNRIDRMEKLLTDLLEYSRVGRVPAAMKRIEMEEFVDALLELASIPPAFTVDCDLSVEPFDTPAAPFERVILNLVTNAVKHHDAKDGTIEITARDDGDEVVVSIADDGPGIDPLYRERIFDLFRTLKPRDDVEGSGMGLAMVRKIVASHDGEIELESVVGEGATFTVRWPRNYQPQSMEP